MKNGRMGGEFHQYIYINIVNRLKLVTTEEKEIKDAIQLLENALKKEVN